MLQTFGANNFPLEKYIVNVDTNISPPSYLNEDTTYGISNGFPESEPNSKIWAVKIMNATTWPLPEELNLNETQLEAYKAALTNQLVVIQGPPGKWKFA